MKIHLLFDIIFFHYTCWKRSIHAFILLREMKEQLRLQKFPEASA